MTMQAILENLRVIGPVFAAVWALTIAFTVLRPQRYLNSILLMIALMVTMIFASGFFSGEARAYFLLICFLTVMLFLFMVPILLIVNGIQMIKRESLCVAHVLSLALGIVVGIGEIATVVYVLNISEYISIGNADRWMLFISFTVF